jgi:hypothetical protein
VARRTPPFNPQLAFWQFEGLSVERGPLCDPRLLEKQYMRAQLERAGTPGPRAIGIDEISVRKGHSYRIVVSDLVRK